MVWSLKIKVLQAGYELALFPRQVSCSASCLSLASGGLEACEKEGLSSEQVVSLFCHHFSPPALQHALCIYRVSNIHHLPLKLLSCILVLLVIHFYLFILKILFILCVWVFCLHICLYNMCVPCFLLSQSSENNTIS